MFLVELDCLSWMVLVITWVRNMLLTDCVPKELLAFFTRFLQESKSNLQQNNVFHCYYYASRNAYLFDSSTPFSLVTAFMSPSKNFRSGCTKLMYDAPMNSRSHWPIFCSACPTLVSALPYASFCPNTAPACQSQF